MPPHHPADPRAEFAVELSTASRKMRTLFDSMVRERGLTLSRARALLHLSRYSPVNQTELAAVLEIEGSTMVRLLDGLEEQGLVARNHVDGDRRAKLITLTASATAQVGELERLIGALRQTVLGNIAQKDLEVAVRILRQVVANVEHQS